MSILMKFANVKTQYHIDQDILQYKKEYDDNIYTKTKLRGFSPQANYTESVTTACQRS
jgi:hypothetical protein